MRRRIGLHLAVLAGYLAASVVLTWPHARYLADHQLPATLDTGSYVWGLWWLAHCAGHLVNPWTTGFQAAPAGALLGLHSLMPLAGLVMAPVTAAVGPSASFDLLSIATPGLLGYAAYRVARLWLPGQAGPIAAGALFGFCQILSWQAGHHISLAVAALFLPMSLEAAVRLRRRPRVRQAVLLGVITGASMLVDQETAIMVGITVVAALVPWLAGQRLSARPRRTPAADGKTAEQDPAESETAEGETTEEETAPRERAGGLRFALAARWRRARALAGPERGQLRVLARRWLARLALAALAAAVALVVALPQLLAIRQEQAAGGVSAKLSPKAYLQGTRLPYLFEPSPRIMAFGLHLPHGSGSYTFGLMLTVLAVAGLVAARRRPAAWLLALLFLAAAALSLGSNLHTSARLPFTPDAELVRGYKLSLVMPFTYFVRPQLLAQFREPSRLAELGLLPAALLAGCAVTWLRRRTRPVLVVVAALCVLEAGQLSVPVPLMPTTMPAVDRPIAASRPGSIVVALPFGLRGGVGITGQAFPPQTQVLATADEHPLADAYLARIPKVTATQIGSRYFYRYLMQVQDHPAERLSQAQYGAARASARRMGIGWVVLWKRDPLVSQYLARAGFRLAYAADGAQVYRPVPQAAAAASRAGG